MRYPPGCPAVGAEASITATGTAGAAGGGALPVPMKSSVTNTVPLETVTATPM